MKFETKDTLNPRKVTEFVLSAHHDLDKVQQLLEQDPRLVNATLDMGNGDFESALDASAHMGRPDIARYLIENGARFDFLFLMATLDEVEIVKTIISAFPQALHQVGVHRFSLHHFAEKGNATRVLDYLTQSA